MEINLLAIRTILACNISKNQVRQNTSKKFQIRYVNPMTKLIESMDNTVCFLHKTGHVLYAKKMQKRHIKALQLYAKNFAPTCFLRAFYRPIVDQERFYFREWKVFSTE
jgi:hypothetical protein